MPDDLMNTRVVACPGPSWLILLNVCRSCSADKC